MKHVNKIAVKAFVLAFACATLGACKKKDETPSAFSGDYGVALRVETTDGTADYIVQTNSIMDGEISAEGTGIEQPGWCYYMGSNNSLFSINYGDEGTKAYIMNSDDALQEKGSFWVDRLDMTGDFDDSHVVGVGAPWGGGSFDCELMIIDADKVAITSRKTDQIYRMSATDTLNKWPSGAVGNGNNIFLAFYPLGGVSWKTPITDTAYLNIYEYPTLKYVKTIKDTRSGPIGIYGSQPCIFKTENGDIYTFSSNSIAYGQSETGNPSGILRVKNGATEFDPTYFLDFEDKFAGRIVMGAYLGGGKALVRYISVTEDNAAPVGGWAGFSLTNYLFNMAIVDLETQTVTQVQNLPKHAGGFCRPVYVENGKGYLSIVSATEARIYEIDPTTATAKKGALIKGNEVPFIYKFK